MRTPTLSSSLRSSPWRVFSHGSSTCPDIVGAFLAGLAVNAAVHDKPAKEKLEFIGHSVFIPIFFIATGFLIDPSVFLRSLVDHFALAASVVLALITGKWLAVQIAGRRFGYSTAARRTMWSLTLPQVAATLAATLAAFATFNPAGQRLIDRELLNVVLVLMLTTSILGPMLTDRFARRLLDDENRDQRPPVPFIAPEPRRARVERHFLALCPFGGPPPARTSFSAPASASFRFSRSASSPSSERSISRECSQS